MTEAFDLWIEKIGSLRIPQADRPWVTLSYAQSLDGSIAAVRGKSFAISGPESLRLTHQLRAAHNAILVGVGTVLADDPQLTVRFAQGCSPQPVVVDTHLRIPIDARLFRRSDVQPWIFTADYRADEQFQRRKDQLERHGARVFAVAQLRQGGLDLSSVFQKLAELGIPSVMVEGGARVITSVLSSRLFDYAVVTISPLWLGGLRSVENRLLSDSVPGLENICWQMVGSDMVVAGSRMEKSVE